MSLKKITGIKEGERVGCLKEIITLNTFIVLPMATGEKNSLQNGDELIEGTPDLINHATAFYKNLFGPQLSCCTRLRDEIWSDEEKLSDIDRADMDREFTEE
jgi:hypothetical protein